MHIPSYKANKGKYIITRAYLTKKYGLFGRHYYLSYYIYYKIKHSKLYLTFSL